MTRRFVDDAVAARFTEAIGQVEAASAIELVIKVRHHSGSYAHADLLAGIGAGLAALAFMLLHPELHFSTTALLVDPLIVGVAAGLLSTQLPWLRRWLTPARMRTRQVREAAESAFFRRQISHTSGRTGMLMYVSLLERRVELVCDRGVTDAIDAATIERERQRLNEALSAHFDGAELAAAVTELGPMCAAGLPRAEDDVNELPDQVYFHP